MYKKHIYCNMLKYYISLLNTEYSDNFHYLSLFIYLLLNLEQQGTLIIIDKHQYYLSARHLEDEFLEMTSPSTHKT